MALREETKIDQVNIDEYGNIGVRRTRSVYDGDELVGEKHQRKVYDRDSDVTKAPAIVKAIAEAIWTEEFPAPERPAGPTVP